MAMNQSSQFVVFLHIKQKKDMDSSHPRNKDIAYAFFKAGFIESWERGYKKIREGFEGAGLPMPKVEDIEGDVRVIFQRNNVNSSQTSSNMILGMIKKNSKITIAEIAREIGISNRMIAKYLRRFQDDGLIKRKGGRFGGEWIILEEQP